MTKKTRQSIFSENMYFTAYSQNISQSPDTQTLPMKIKHRLPSSRETKRALFGLKKKTAKTEKDSVHQLAKKPPRTLDANTPPTANKKVRSLYIKQYIAMCVKKTMLFSADYYKCILELRVKSGKISQASSWLLQFNNSICMDTNFYISMHQRLQA